MTGHRITSAAFFALVALAPLGTRFIWRVGVIDGVSVEPGTISLFGTQILAALYVIAAIAAAGRPAASRAMRSPAAALAAILAAAALVSVAQSADRAASLLVASWIVLGAAVFIAMLADRPRPQVFFSALITGAALQSVLGAWQFFSQSAPASKWLGMAAHQAGMPGVFVVETEAGRWLRAYGTLGHPNVYGFYITLGILACVGLIALTRHLRSREPLLALLPLLTAGLFFSFSRSAVIALSVGLACYLVLTARPHLTRISPVAVLSVLSIAAAFFAMGSIYREPALMRATGQGRLELRSWNERQELTDDAFRMISGHALWGVGAGEMPHAVWREAADGRNVWQYQSVHNLPLLVLVEAGAVGLAVWIGFVILVLLLAFRSVRAGGAPAAAVLAASFAAVLTAGMFDHYFWSSWTGQLFFWLVAGMVAAAVGTERYVSAAAAQGQ